LGVRVRVLAVDGQGDVGEQGVQQLLAVLVSGGLGGPDGAEVVGEGQDGGALGRGEGGRSAAFAAGQLAFGGGEGGQGFLPVGLQAAGDQAVVGVDGPVAAFGPGSVVTGALDRIRGSRTVVSDT
jgi:hypothetical protein